MPIDIHAIIGAFVEAEGSDLYLTSGAPPSFRLGEEIHPQNHPRLTDEDVRAAMVELFSPDVIEEFDATLEFNTALHWKEKARFRVNLFRQRQSPGIVMRRIRNELPTLAELELPPIYADLIMQKRGLILVVGPTNSGKSTSLAAMLNHRNHHGNGHIVTIEDPIEYLYEHKKCIFTQRDIGIDTYSFSIALKNALRQTPDVIVIGEIRDRDTMEQAIIFSETGHLCLATLHANNTNQAIERVINFFPEEKHRQIYMNLSFNLHAILSQRLVPNVKGSRSMVLEILLNQGLVKNLIQEGHVREIREVMEKGHDVGMQTFDQALLEIYDKGIISEAVAIAQCDNPANMRLAIKQHDMIKRSGALRQHNNDLELVEHPSTPKPQF